MRSDTWRGSFRAWSLVSFFISAAALAAPAVSNLAVYGVRVPLDVAVETTDAVDRVSFFADGAYMGTDYSPPFEWELDPAWDDLPPERFEGTHELEARAFGEDDSSSTFASTASLLTDCAGRLPQVELLHPYPGFTIYTSDHISPPTNVPVEVAAAYVYPGIHPTFFTPEIRSQAVRRVEFYLDGDLLHTASNGVPGNPYRFAYTLAAGSLTQGYHSLRVRCVPSNGCPAGAYARIRVAGPPHLLLTRTVRRSGSHFQVEVEVENTGTGDARDLVFTDSVLGFHIAASTADVHTAVARYAAGSHKSTVTFTRGSLYAGNTAVFRYDLVPVLYVEPDVTYRVGGYGNLTYEADNGNPGQEPFNLVSPSVLGAGGERLSLEAEVDRAIRASDYLLVTNPQNLFALYDTAEVNDCLAAMAELAVVRGGVLGYYRTYVPVSTVYRRGDPLGFGDVFGTGRGHVVLGDVSDDLVRLYNLDGEATYDLETSDGSSTPLYPFAFDWRDGDGMTVGNLVSLNSVGGVHRAEEVAIGLGSGHGADAGKVRAFTYVFEPGVFTFSAHDFDPGYAATDRIFAGDLVRGTGHAPDRDELVLLHADGTVDVFEDMNATPLASFATGCGGGCVGGVGRILTEPDDVLAVGDPATGQVEVYLWNPFTSTFDVAASFTTADLWLDTAMAVGNVVSGAKKEILLARGCLDEIALRAHYGGTTLAQEGPVEVPFGGCDPPAVLAGDFMGDPLDEILVAYPRDVGSFRRGDVAAFGYGIGERPGDRGHLDGLLNAGGAWANRLARGWADNGHLLLVGEVPILPAFTADWYLTWNVSLGDVDTTDRNYASTAGSTHYPELAMGRIVGNTAWMLAQPLRASIAIARGEVPFGPNSAYAVSGRDRGPDDDADRIDFSDTRDTVADLLRDDGFSVHEQGDPSVAEFFDRADDRDLVLMLAHGNEYWWDVVAATHVDTMFDPGDRHPLVYGYACSTGRYPSRNLTVVEAFLSRGASAYIGATEDSVSPWAGRILENFIARVDASRTLGRSFRDAIRHRLGVNTYDWDPNYNRYNCAIHHYFGDPKLSLNWGGSPVPPAGSGQAVAAASAGPVTVLEWTLPDYKVTAHPDGGDRVTLPGQPMLEVVGQAAVPTYVARVAVPAGYRVQAVTLQERGQASTESNLEIPAVSPAVVGGTGAGGATAAAAAAWWPDRDYAWEVETAADRSSELILTVYPFFYDAKTKEAEYYKDYRFGVAYQASPLEVMQFAARKPSYDPKETVVADLRLFSTNDPQQEIDVTSTVTVLKPDGTASSPPDGRVLKSVRGGLSTCSFSWDSTGYPTGDYEMQLDLKGPQGEALAYAAAPFRLGTRRARVNGVTVWPPAFQRGDPLEVRAEIGNTGSEALAGTVVFVLEDAAGSKVGELREGFSGLGPNGSLSVSSVWQVCSLSSRDLNVRAFVVYDGRTTPLWTERTWEEGSLVLDVERGAPSGPVLHWDSASNRTYTLSFGTNLDLTSFTNVVHGVPATPPLNSFTDAVRQVEGYYLLEEAW